MSLATRCSSCGTVFRVVPDQLRVSEGWVRCGRCDAVFDATESLFDIDSGEPVVLADLRPPPEQALAPAPFQAPAAAPVHPRAAGDEPAWHEPPARAPAPSPVFAPTPAPARPDASADPADDPLADVVPADWHLHQRMKQADADRGPAPPAVATPAAAPAAAGPAVSAAEAGPLLRAPSTDDEASTGHQMLGWMRPQRRQPPLTDAVAAGAAIPAPAADPNAPSFVRAAERAAWWSRPAVRSGLVAACGLLGALLLAQLMLLWRDPLAAHMPSLAPMVRGLCRLSGCTVQPLRRIDQLSVDSSGLNRAEGSPNYRLQLTLRNRGDTALMLPALDLTLTDNQGKLVARRVLQAAELGLARTNVIERGQELPVKVLLSTGEYRIDGYTVELFYP